MSHCALYHYATSKQFTGPRHTLTAESERDSASHHAHQALLAATIQVIGCIVVSDKAKETMEAAEIMEKKVVSLGASSSLLDAASLMHEHNIRHLPIVEHNEVVGILSERDLHGFLEELYESTQETTDGFRRKHISIREVMQNKPLTVDPSADIVDVIDLMIENKVGALIVSDELGQLRGIVSYEDILKLAKERFASV